MHFSSATSGLLFAAAATVSSSAIAAVVNSLTHARKPHARHPHRHTVNLALRGDGAPGSQPLLLDTGSKSAPLLTWPDA